MSKLRQLKKTRTLRKLGIPRLRIDSPTTPLRHVPVKEERLLPTVYPPFRSVEEVMIWELIQDYDQWWQPMVQLFGGVGVPGGTEIDFYNGVLRIAIYADGPPHQLPEVAARDLVLRKAVEATGLKVLAFKFRLPEEVTIHFPEWYRENIG